MTTTTTTPVTLAQLLDVLLPVSVLAPGGDGCLKLVAHPVGVAFAVDTVVQFARLPGWVRLRRYGWRESPETLAQFCAAHGEHAIGFSPLAWSGPDGVPRSPVAALWATVPIPCAPAPGMEPLLRPEPTAAARVRALVEGMTPAPSLVIDEGDRLALGWLLAEPVDLPQAEAASTVLACRLRGVPEIYPPEPLAGLLIGVPTTRNARLFPTPDIAVITWEPEGRYSPEDLVAHG